MPIFAKMTLSRRWVDFDPVARTLSDDSVAELERVSGEGCDDIPAGGTDVE